MGARFLGCCVDFCTNYRTIKKKNAMMAAEGEEGAPFGSGQQRSQSLPCAHAANLRRSAFVPVSANNVGPFVRGVVRCRLIVVATMAHRATVQVRRVAPITTALLRLWMVVFILTNSPIALSLLMPPLLGLTLDRTTPSCRKSSHEPLAFLF